MSNDLALVKKGTVDVVAKKVREFQEKGELFFPESYSSENALKSAWLTLQTTVNKNQVSVLDSCTKDSIANSLLDMVVQGLTPAKKQGYFIAYGNKLVFQRSYFGTMAVTKRVTGAKDIIAQVVYEGDDFDYEIQGAKKKVIAHKQKLGNVNKDKIIGAYCTISFPDGEEFTEVMSMDEIQQSWKMSKSKQSSTHSDFTQEMAKKTVVNRTCKAYINSSDDSSLVMKHFKGADESVEEAQIEEEVSVHANSEIIDVEYQEVEDDQPVDVEYEVVDEFASNESEPDF